MEKNVNSLISPFKIIKLDLIILIVPALLWVAATYSRSSIITPRCSIAPQTCQKESIFPPDRLSVGLENSQADEYSYRTQNISGALAFSLPFVTAAVLFFLGRLNILGALTAFGTDLVIVLQTTTWNGLLTEVSHLIVQRPRPFVFLDPAVRGIDPAHYTSFYSGHTSYSAAMTTLVLLILIARGAPFFILFLAAILAEILIFSTAYFRIFAGRHFLTDVVSGAIVGSLVAWTIVRYHRKRGQPPILLRF